MSELQALDDLKKSGRRGGNAEVEFALTDGLCRCDGAETAADFNVDATLLEIAVCNRNPDPLAPAIRDPGLCEGNAFVRSGEYVGRRCERCCCDCRTGGSLDE